MTATAAKAYKIASGDTLTNLEKAVNQFIAAGWQPYGPPFLTHDNRLVQALIVPAGAGQIPASAAVPPGASATPAPASAAGQAGRAQAAVAPPMRAAVPQQSQVPPGVAQPAPSQSGSAPGGQPPQGGLGLGG